MDRGYSYYGEVGLGYSFILAILDQVIGHTCQIMDLICPLGTFCPLGRFVPWDVLSLRTFCPWDIQSLRRFVPWDFCHWDVFSWDVLSWDVLYVHQLLYLVGWNINGRTVWNRLCASGTAAAGGTADPGCRQGQKASTDGQQELWRKRFSEQYC